MGRKVIPPFDPKQPPIRTTTLARQVARQNLTTLNNALWVTENSHTLVRSSFTAITMPKGIGAHGCYGSASQWIAAVDEQHLWARQHVLVSAASLLEVYLTTAISAALWASPEYADRSLSGVREVELIKFSGRAPGLAKLIRKHAKAILNGRWSERFRQMAIVFGKLPPRLDAICPHLQDIQDKRNRIAHSFGQNSESFRRTPWQPIDAIKLEVSDVEEALTRVNEVTRELDINVFARLIGGYEFLYEYHLWRQDIASQNPFTRPSPDKYEATFRKHIKGKFGNGPSKEYFRSMIRYYDACI